MREYMATGLLIFNRSGRSFPGHCHKESVNATRDWRLEHLADL
jgi:hypothetical protein